MPEHFSPWFAFHAEVPAFIAVIAVLGIWIRSRESRVKLPSAIWLMVALSISATIQWLCGVLVYGGDALLVSTYFLLFAGAWLWGHQWASGQQKANFLTHVSYFLLSSGLFVAFQVFAQWLGVEGAFGGWVIDGVFGGRPRGNIGQPNHAATMLLMGVVSTVLLRVYARIGAVTMWSAAIFLGASIVLTQSRTALLSAAVLVCLFVCISRKDTNQYLMRRAVLVWLTLLYMGSWLLPISDSGIHGGALPLSHLATTGTRPLLWKQLILALFEQPWTGWGWLQIATAQQSGALVAPGFEQINYAHNIVLELFLAVGIPIACTVVGVILYWGWRRFPLFRKSPASMQAFLLLLPFCVHSMLEMPYAYAYFLVVAGLLMGAIDVWTMPISGVQVSLPKKVVAFSVIAFGAVLIATGYEYTLVEEDFRIQRFENRLLGVTPPDYAKPQLYLLTQLGDLLQAMRMRAAPNMKTIEVDLLVRVSKRYSWAPIQFRTALALGLNGRPEEATQRLQVIKSLFTDDVYAEAKESLARLAQSKYPELAKVVLP